MVIEWLKFKVSPQSRDTFIQIDHQIWTATLAKFPGFLGKEVWISPDIPGEITLIVHWKTREQWKAVPQEILEETEQNFSRQMNNNSYEMIESKEYQIRKYPTN
ncbi:MAG: TIGR03792 family protein [Cyanobacteria bacterium P01_G01_bin.49]